MPILEVEIVVAQGETLPPGLAAAIADRAAAVFGTSPGRTWVRLRALPVDHYAENGGGPPPDVRPVFVSILHARLPAGEMLRREIALLTEAVASACDRPADTIHLFYQPDGVGRVAFGGILIETP